MGCGMISIMRALYLVSVWLHIVAAAAWIGSMLSLAPVLVPSLRSPAFAANATGVLLAFGERFRSVGWVTLLVLVATGSVNSAMRSGSWGRLGALTNRRPR